MEPNNATAADIGAAFGVSDRTVREDWIRDGCPHEVRPVRRGNGKAYYFSYAAVSRWYARREIERAIGDVSDIDTEEAKRRKLAAEAELAEIEVKKARAVLAEVSVMASEVGRDYGRVRARLVQMPSSLAPKLVFLGDIQKGQQILTDAVNDALRELSGPPDDTGDTEEDTADALQADPAVDGKRVGGQVRKATRGVRSGAGKVEYRQS